MIPPIVMGLWTGIGVYLSIMVTYIFYQVSVK